MNEQDFTLIEHSAWGQMTVIMGDQILHFRDCKVWPGGAIEWNWKETGTQHDPGIQPADIDDLVKHAVHIVVLGQGVFSRLGVCSEAESLLKDLGIEVHKLDTRKAVETYNKFVREGRRVGGLFHSTC